MAASNRDRPRGFDSAAARSSIARGGWYGGEQLLDVLEILKFVIHGNLRDTDARNTCGGQGSWLCKDNTVIHGHIIPHAHGVGTMKWSLLLDYGL
eukprot:scaffold267480_cov36-Tisochrysis_lutea.AAC.2